MNVESEYARRDRLEKERDAQEKKTREQTNKKEKERKKFADKEGLTRPNESRAFLW